jgi:hypothetical protein
MRLLSLVLLVSTTAVVTAFPQVERRAYTYGGSTNGLPGSGVGGYYVPAPGDTAHAFQKPGPSDIRGPCPGMNVLANYGFIARNGITNYAEIVSALQNAFNLGFDHATVLTTLGVASCGDIVTGKLSIGMDATSRTSLLGLGLLGPEPGLNGHNVSYASTGCCTNTTRNSKQMYRSPAMTFTLGTTMPSTGLCLE